MRFEDTCDRITNGTSELLRKTRKDIIELLEQAIDAVDPYKVVSAQFDAFGNISESQVKRISDAHRIFVVGFGKASVGMTRAVLDHCDVYKGVLITNDGAERISHPSIATYHGGHPLPNEGSIKGTMAIEALLSQVTTTDVVLVLISGGGSALLCHPRIPLNDLQKTTSLLLKSGATIQEINTIRKHLSYVKGGQLVQNISCPVVSFIISDVIGDPMGFIASGPTVGDETTFSDAQQIFQTYQVWGDLPESVQFIINQGIQKGVGETPFPDEIEKKQVENRIVANNALACSALYQQAKARGYHPWIYSTTLEGDTGSIGPQLIDVLLEAHQNQGKNMVIAGGETTVVVKGNGRGGRNQQMVLSMVPKLARYPLVFASCGTDGVDGMSPAAGAIADTNTLSRAEAGFMDYQVYLKDNDSFTFFSNLNDTLLSGPTGTNVMDLQVGVILTDE